MGDISDSMINGEFDFYTGEYIGKPVGYPRTRRKPYRNEDNHAASIGIRMFLQNNGIQRENFTSVVREYFTTVLGRGKNKKLNEMCIVVQENFNKFSQTTYKKK